MNSDMFTIFLRSNDSWQDIWEDKLKNQVFLNWHESFLTRHTPFEDSAAQGFEIVPWFQVKMSRR
jgi:hypothetical protein